jgi:signal transduction histidine kinase
MKKVALVFVLAVFVPSLVLAWLAVRSLRDQQLVLERQQSLLYQGVADAVAKEAAGLLAEHQRDFARQVEALLVTNPPVSVAASFDQRLRKDWPLADVGFTVSLDGQVYSPNLFDRAEARRFRLENDKFLCSRESVAVYWNSPKGNINLSQLDEKDASAAQQAQSLAGWQSSAGNYSKFVQEPKLARNVEPQQKVQAEPDNNSRVTPSEAEFRQLIGDSTEGTLARFLQNKLNLMFWYRSPRDPQLVFGALIHLPRLSQALRAVVKVDPQSLAGDVCVALLDDTARPVAVSHPQFQTNWKRPFVATEIGEVLPHWEVAVYLLNPKRLTQSAHTLRLTLGLLIAVLVLAIAGGGWLVVLDLKRQLTLARQKTDFVSNVSHELKTPLTSIRMFSELLAEGRVTDREKQRSYFNIITAETARLTRLINNVLDFSRMDRGEKKYNVARCDLVGVVRETVESYRPHLEAGGFTLACELPESPLWVNGDRDALSQIVVNLLSNAEKYSSDRKEVRVEIGQLPQPVPHVEVRVLDRGLGVPPGSEEKIFEQFYRAHDSLSSGIQGSGLGLTLARQIARAHGGDITCKPRQGGGSCFALRLPAAPLSTPNSQE